MKFIVLEPVKIAGKVRKPNEIVDDELLSETQLEQLFTANLIAGYEDSSPVTDPSSLAGSGSAHAEQGATTSGSSQDAQPPANGSDAQGLAPSTEATAATAAAKPATKTATKTARRRS